MSYGYDYEPKENSSYLKFKDGGSVDLRILKGPLHYEKVFEGDTKPRDRFIWLVLVTGKDVVPEVKLLEQGTTIYKALRSLAFDEEWGDPATAGYDVRITAKGNGKEREYAVAPRKPRPLTRAELDAIEQSTLELRDPTADSSSASAPAEYDPFSDD